MSSPIPDRPVGLAPRPKVRRRLLGQMLVDRGVVDQAQLDEVLLRQKTERGSRVGRLLVDSGYVSEAQICEVIADQLNIPAADLAAVDVPPEVLARVPKDLCQKYQCLPWFLEGKDLYLIMADPTNLAAADAVAFAAGLRVKPVVAPESEVVAALDRFYSDEEASLAQFENIEVDIAGQLAVVSESEMEIAAEEDLEKAAQAIPLVKLVNGILTDAIRAGASDIHIEPQLKSVVLRYRVDGLLRQVMTMPKSVQQKVVSRIKVMSQMDISERRKPQDGRAFIRLEGKQYDMRVSSLPTADGEKVVIRILMQERAKVALEDLGFEPDVVATLKELLKRPQGMILVTGPTGSGKTSTLYASLNQLLSETTNIVTVEDPVEYRLAGVNQVAVSDRAGLTFAAGLAVDPSTGSGRRHGGRDPRPGDRARGFRSSPDRPPRPLDAPHQRCAQRRDPPRGDGHSGLRGGLVARGGAGPAPGAALVRVQDRESSTRRGGPGSARASASSARACAVLPSSASQRTCSRSRVSAAFRAARAMSLRPSPRLGTTRFTLRPARSARNASSSAASARGMGMRIRGGIDPARA